MKIKRNMETEQNKTSSYLSFTLAGELFAIHVDYVIKIMEMTTFTKIPQGPPYLLGVTNLTGSVLPVIDSYLKFGFDPPQKEQSVIIVLNVSFNGKSTEIGITADVANEVFEVSKEEIKPYPALGSKYNAEYIKGVINRENRFVLILNVEKLFSEDEINDLIQ
jgi:purine-binding chemotaxis protein CheW